MSYSEMHMLADGLARVMGLPKVADVRIQPLGDGEQGYSGAAMHRLIAALDDGRQESFICKRTDLKERMVMKTLTAQGRRHTPAAFSSDCASDDPAWMIQQDLGRRVAAPIGYVHWMERTAEALAEIHADSMGCGADMPWLPHADAAYWQFITTQISIDHFERMVAENEAFARQFGHQLPRLRDAGERFAKEMSALYAEGESLTLTHGDLQSIDGDHVYNVAGKPCIIDFGFARYAPFYIDLVDYFAPDDSRLYHRALQRAGKAPGWSDFEDRFRAAYPYPGFIYMYPSIAQWMRGSDERLRRTLARILR